MPTHALGQGTSNVVFNVPTEEKAEYGRLANRLGISVGEFIRRAVAKKAAEVDAASALRIAAARSRRASFLASHVPTLVALGIFAVGYLTGHSDLRRPIRSVQNVRSIRRWEEAA